MLTLGIAAIGFVLLKALSEPPLLVVAMSVMRRRRFDNDLNSESLS